MYKLERILRPFVMPNKGWVWLGKASFCQARQHFTNVVQAIRVVSYLLMYLRFLLFAVSKNKERLRCRDEMRFDASNTVLTTVVNWFCSCRDRGIDR